MFTGHFFLFALCVSMSSAFFTPTLRISRDHNVRMMFGGSKPKPITIKVDGNKVIELSEPGNMRKALQANKVDVYPLVGKFNNCGGAGICGTCAVKVLEGGNNINPQSKNEQNTLRGKPADWRLSCCSKVSGPITIKTKP